MTNDSWPWDMFPEDTSTWEQCLKERTELLDRLERYEKALDLQNVPIPIMSTGDLEYNNGVTSGINWLRNRCRQAIKIDQQ